MFGGLGRHVSQTLFDHINFLFCGETNNRIWNGFVYMCVLCVFANRTVVLSQPTKIAHTPRYIRPLTHISFMSKRNVYRCRWVYIDFRDLN